VITVVGISHHTAPVELRERFAVSSEALPSTLALLQERHGSAVLLSTCNRTELYLSRAAPQEDPEALREALAALAPDAPRPHPDSVYIHTGREAARHLLRVAAGLDSMVLGEDQILGQVRAAFVAAAAAGTTDRLLSRLFHLAIASGRRVRNQTTLGRYAVSVSAAAVDAVRRQLADLQQATVLLIGAGDAGKLSARTLARLGTGRLLVASRTPERARRVAGDVGGSAVGPEELAGALAAADAVICASAAPGYQLTRAMLREAGRDGSSPLLVVDIAVPRDVEPAVAEEPGVTLLDIDHLRAEPLAGGLPDVAAAEAIVEDEVGRLASWWDTLRVVPTISALRERAEDIRRAELARTFGRMSHLSEEERGRIEAMTAAIVNKMLHQPIARLKQPGAGERYAEVVHELFGLPPAANE
jgi:glutamyl-tRNA reductase